MKLAVGFIMYNESSWPYLPYFLPSLKEAVLEAVSSSHVAFAFDNSFSGKNDEANFAEENLKLINSFSENNPDLNLKYLSQNRNLGFSKAYNLMIEEAIRLKAEYFLVINPDTVLDKESLKVLLSSLSLDACAASATPKIKVWDFKNKTFSNKIDSLGIVLSPGLKFRDCRQGDDDSDALREEVIGPSGAAALFRLSNLEKISEERDGKKQYFDERFFMYKEDCDLAYRLFLGGFSSVFCPKALIYHDRTAFSDKPGFINKVFKRSKKSRQVRIWSFRNQHLLYFKHFSKQDLRGKCLIVLRILSFLLFSLIFERFLLKEYKKVINLSFFRGKLKEKYQ